MACDIGAVNEQRQKKKMVESLTPVSAIEMVNSGRLVEIGFAHFACLDFVVDLVWIWTLFHTSFFVDCGVIDAFVKSIFFTKVFFFFCLFFFLYKNKLLLKAKAMAAPEFWRVYCNLKKIWLMGKVKFPKNYLTVH